MRGEISPGTDVQRVIFRDIIGRDGSTDGPPHRKLVLLGGRGRAPEADGQAKGRGVDGSSPHAIRDIAHHRARSHGYEAVRGVLQTDLLPHPRLEHQRREQRG